MIAKTASITTDETADDLNTFPATATYDPEDDKIRIYFPGKPSPEHLERMRALRMTWAPKQGCNFGVWTQGREDFALEVAGEITDEDSTLQERAEARAERFEGYSEKRKAEADRAYDAAGEIGERFAGGQPILVGHHSERKARKDAERIQANMGKAASQWRKAERWRQRAEGAIANALYKQTPEVRHRRIKTIEAEIRQIEGQYTPAEPRHESMQYRWGDYGKEGAEPVLHVYCKTKGASRGGSWVPAEDLDKIRESYTRTLEHLRNRIEYEKAMIGEAGGLRVDPDSIEIGGSVLYGKTWRIVTRINKGASGEVVSVTAGGNRGAIDVEKIAEYKPPTHDAVKAAKKATSLPPILNYPGEGFQEITQAQWDRIGKDYKGTVIIREDGVRLSRWHADPPIGAPIHQRHRIREAMVSGYRLGPVFITDAKVKHPAPYTPDEDESGLPSLRETDLQKSMAEAQKQAEWRKKWEAEQAEAAKYEAAGKLAKEGVTVVAAPQLFPTPPALAARVIEEADIYAGMEILEPSAGTGALAHEAKSVGGRVWCVEINRQLADMLHQNNNFESVKCCDFLELTPGGIRGEGFGGFDRVVMNPPFANAADIKHVQHAYSFLAPGGRLVAICANGPRQQERLKTWAEELGGTYEPLPAGSFSESGTEVSTALVIVDRD